MAGLAESEEVLLEQGLNADGIALVCGEQLRVAGCGFSSLVPCISLE